MATQNNILSQLGVKSKGTVYMSITPSLGLEIIQLDNDIRNVSAYGYRPLDYNEALREPADYGQFKAAVLELFEEMGIPAKCNVVINLPTVTFGIAERPLILGEDQITNTLISEVEQSYIFKRHEPVVSWVDSSTTVSNDMRKILYSALQQSVIDNLTNALAEIGATLVGVEVSLTSLLKALDYSGETSAQMKDGITWNLLLINSTGYSVISFVGKHIVDFYEEAIALRSLEGNEIYENICSSANIALMNYPANYLYIVSETNLVSAELVAKKINCDGVVDFLENNQFRKKELIPTSLSILPDNVLKISAAAIGIAVPRSINYPVKFEFVQRRASTSTDSNEPVRLQMGDSEVEITPAAAIKLVGVIAAILLIPTLILMQILPKMVNSSQAKVTEINNKVSAVEKQIKELSNDKKATKFNEKETIKATLETNKTKLMSYSALGASVPKELWITHFKSTGDSKIDIVGQAGSVEDVYAFFRNVKDSLINSNLRLHKLQLVSEDDESLIDAGDFAPGYDFEITNMTEQELAETSDDTTTATEKKPAATKAKTSAAKKKAPKQTPQTKSNPSQYAKEVTGKK